MRRGSSPARAERTDSDACRSGCPSGAERRRQAAMRRSGASVPKCGEVLYRRDLAANSYVCTQCGHHFRMGAYDRIASIVDGEFVEIGSDVRAERSARMGRQKDVSRKAATATAKRAGYRSRSSAASARSAASTWAGRDGLSLSRRDDGARSPASGSRCCSKRRASVRCRASCSPRRAARAWKRACWR